MNNAVGYAPTAAFKRAALGTDGLDSDMLAEARVAFLKLRDAGRDDALAAAFAMLVGGQRLADAFFGLPLGRLDAGAPADLVVLDYRPPTPLTEENLAGHLLFGLDRSHVRSTMVAGRLVLRDRRAHHRRRGGRPRERANRRRTPLEADAGALSGPSPAE